MSLALWNGDNTLPDKDEILKELHEENAFLLKLVDTIPAKMYFGQDIQDRISSEKHSTMDLKALSFKRKNTELSTKSKHKRARIDPYFQKSVSQIHHELGSIKERSHKKKTKDMSSASITRAANIAELQKRLHDRISELKSKRKARMDSTKKKKIDNAVKKIKQKIQRNINVPEVQTTSSVKKSKKVPEKQIYNKEGKIMYGKLDFSENGIEDAPKKNEFGGKQYKKLLKKAEKKKEKIENLKNTDPEKATIIEEKEKWKKAILRSENVKVKDDPVLLKKSIKKQEKIKKKKAKVWDGRTEYIEGKQKMHQEKRDKNIKKRKKEKLDKKIKHAKKKGRIVPGF